ncbi:cytochrome c oxidase assembly protein COX20, mitochondrial-like, partial [Stegodyphus dumicola]|uniref:cytochrome c oxidase assembly protein COX20, mitochondrial-like n=1 Tax=Stegodyphus dumicola TaxID=202533 RepID=UPI0015AD4EC1
FTVFGNDLQRIPCFKKTFTVGISSGVIAGLTTFLFTSRVKRSSDIAVITFAVTTLGFWAFCRYNWSKEHWLTQKMNSAVHDVMLNEGIKKRSDT